MASEKDILRVLDLMTIAPKSQIETLGVSTRAHVTDMRRVLRPKNVVAVGISEKITKGKRSGKLALTFYVERKQSMKKLRADLAVPPTVPEAISGQKAIPTDVIAIGRLRPEVNATHSPIQPGNSIGHVDITAGTLGAIVTKNKSLHVLSNSHVLAKEGTAKLGDNIIYPGDADHGKLANDLVAKLSGFKKFLLGGNFVNRVDCAIAEVLPARIGELKSDIKGLALPRGTIKPKRGMKVVKVGRTTGKTSGEIRDINFRFVLNYDEVGPVGFLDQVLCTRYTKPGDSGSLVLDKASGRAVGLHFAGANGGSVFNPIDEVLKALGVKLVTTAAKLPKKQSGKKRESRQEEIGEEEPMSDLRYAEMARRQWSESLRKLGAHSIAVDQVKRGGVKTHAVVAFFEKEPPKTVPKSLEVTTGKKTVTVPLVVQVMEMFKPEKE